MQTTLFGAARPYLMTGSLTLLRTWLAWQWISSGAHKLADPAWMDGTGRGLLGFWKAALGSNPHGGAVITYDWYRAFIQLLVDVHAETWFAKLIATSESGVGIALLLGALVPLAACGGLTMNMSYMLAGSASSNPVLALAAGLLIVGHRHSGVVGLDGLRARLLKGERRPVAVPSRPPLRRVA
jgi:thiosulfate dehydrogenase [quinone] large subunit